MPDDPLHERYADLFGSGPDGGSGAPDPGSDSELVRLVAGLDALYAAPEPPVALAAALDAALRERAARQPRPGAASPASHHPGTPPRALRFHAQEGRTPVIARRLPALLGGLAALLVVGLMAGLLLSARGGHGTGPTAGGETPQQRFARLGGVEVVLHVNRCGSTSSYAVDCYTNGPLPTAVLDAVRHRAVVGLGVSDPDVHQTGDEAITADLPGYTDQQQAASLLGARGEVDFVDAGGEALTNGADVRPMLCNTGCKSGQLRVIVTGDQVDHASVKIGTDEHNGQPFVSFNFAGAARTQFEDYAASARQHAKGMLNVVLDGLVLTSVPLSAQDGAADLTLYPGGAQPLAAFLRTGSLPQAVAVVQVTYVQPGAAAACATPTAGTTATATPTPGPSGGATGATSYVRNVVTASGVDSQFNPVGITSQFAVNSDVYVVMAVRNIAAGTTHTVSVRWFLQGQDLQLPPTAENSITVGKDQQVSFALTYPQPGVGMAKVYVDAAGNLNDPANPTLAATVTSTVVQSAGTTATATPFPTPTATPGGSGGRATGGDCATPPTTETPTPAAGNTPVPTPTATPGTTCAGCGLGVGFFPGTAWKPNDQETVTVIASRAGAAQPGVGINLIVSMDGCGTRLTSPPGVTGKDGSYSFPFTLCGTATGRVSVDVQANFGGYIYSETVHQ